MAGSGTAEALDRVLHAAGPAGKWSEILGVVDVPETAGQIVILLSVAGQRSDRDRVWFDDVGLYRLD